MVSSIWRFTSATQRVTKFLAKYYAKSSQNTFTPSLRVQISRTTYLPIPSSRIWPNLPLSPLFSYLDHKKTTFPINPANRHQLLRRFREVVYEGISWTPQNLINLSYSASKKRTMKVKKNHHARECTKTQIRALQMV